MTAQSKDARSAELSSVLLLCWVCAVYLTLLHTTPPSMRLLASPRLQLRKPPLILSECES